MMNGRRGQTTSARLGWEWSHGCLLEEGFSENVDAIIDAFDDLTPDTIVGWMPHTSEVIYEVGAEPTTEDLEKWRDEALRRAGGDAYCED